jgi:hypothetical protein
MAREIHLSRGLVAIVDDDCFDWLSQWKWHASDQAASLVYATRHSKGPITDRKTTVYMHRVLAGAGGSEKVDHANGDSLDNRRSNLRFCDLSQNAANTKRPPGKSGFRGVYPSGNGWSARIEYRGERHMLGFFNCRIEAARTYDAAARQHHGAFALLNFPAEGERAAA